MSDEQYKVLGGLIFTISSLLIEKGIFTQEEFDAQLIRSNQQLDQVFEEKREETRKEIEEKYSGLSKVPALRSMLFPGVFDDNLGVKL